MWEWLAESTTPVARGSMLVVVLLVLLGGVIIGWAIGARSG